MGWTMTTQHERLSGSNENLTAHALAPVTRWLIDAAKQHSILEYGRASRFLSQQHGFNTIFSTRMGFVAGALMERIHDAVPNAPLLNVLLVRQSDHYPGDGAGWFMAQRFKKKWLEDKRNRERRWEEWSAFAERAIQEVYAFDDWDEVYRKTFKSKPIEDGPFHQQPLESDGKFGGIGGGEGKNHRKLRIWAKNNPEKIVPRLKILSAETEFKLLSGDRVDVVFLAGDKSVVIEVKSRDSNDADLERGLYQCIKYRAVKAAADGRQDADVQAILLTEQPLPSDIKARARQHNVRHLQKRM